MTLSNYSHTMYRFMAATVLALSLGTIHAQDATNVQNNEAYEPRVGQVGKDVMWVPTPQSLVDQMLKMAAITPEDYLVDLGSGDGRTVITAAQRGTRAHGIEFNPDLVELSRRAAKLAGVSETATFTQGDIFETNFSDATVVTLFLLPELNLQLRPTLLDMKPGTRIVSNSFDMGDWEVDDSAHATTDCTSYCYAYKWIVPAKVAGTWQLDDRVSLTLDQNYQKLTGYLMEDGRRYEIDHAALQGADIAFTANGRQYTGEVSTNQMTGRDQHGNLWTATRMY
ncbi:class I SAM-dependent methyltransferase [Orrella sp. 11846]|uniref:class I SAM-dependent methyltransferase n=1 Tax=Orrella sp. 11846 TaxID=3409913 RepID=UPI003B58E469